METLGEWSNAPLVYVLAELRTERIADVKAYQAKFGERLRELGYPIQRTMHAAKLVATGHQMIFEPEQDAIWEFATPDNRTAVMLRSNGLVLHATAYKHEVEFLTHLHAAIAVLAEEIPSVYINRIGLRYVDFVLPGKGEEPETYVDARLFPNLGLAKETSDVTSTSVAMYSMGKGRQLTLRYTRGCGKPELPPDLGMLSLDPSPLMNPSNVDSKSATAVIDTDCNLTYSPVEKMDAAKVQAQFESIYGDVFLAFNKAITGHARKVWGAI